MPRRNPRRTRFQLVPGRRPRRRGRRRLNYPALLRLAVGAAVLVALAFLGRGYVLSFAFKVASAQAGSVDDVVTGEAIVARREETVVAPVAGALSLVVPEGERVRFGQVVAEINNPAGREALREDLARARQAVAEFDRTKGPELARVVQELETTGREIETANDRLKQAIQARDQKAIAALQARLEELLTKKVTLDSQRKLLESDRGDLVREEERLAGLLERAAYPLSAPRPGAVSYRFDGLEDVLVPERLDRMEVKRFLALKEKPATIEDRSQVQAGRPVFKIIDTIDTYLVIALPAAPAREIAGTGSATLRFSDLSLREVTVRITALAGKEDGGLVLLVGRVEESLPELAGQRRLKVEVVKNSYTGILLPRRALVTRGDQTGVYLVRYGEASFRPVKVLGGNDRVVAVTGLNPGAQIIINPWLAREGSRVRSQAREGNHD